jgi:membrane fusion protein
MREMPLPSLFRPAAVDFQRNQVRWGEVSSLQPLSVKLTSWFLVCVIIGLIGFLVVAQYARKETAIGYLTPTKGTAKIFVPKAGIIREVHVREGEPVSAGKPVLTIETDQIAADGSDVNAALLKTLDEQKMRLSSNIKDEEVRSQSERERLTSVSKGLEDEISQLRTQSDLQADRLKISENDLEAGRQLYSKGYATAVDFRKRQLAVLELRQLLSNLGQQIAAKENQLLESRFALSQLPTVMAQKIQALRNDLAGAEQRMAEINGRSAYVIRTPVAGRVTTLQARAGQNADPQRLQLEIIPADSVLQAELFVPSRAIGFVKPGQPVRILYDAFPYQHFGTYRGEIVDVSQTILTGADAGAPFKLNEPAYRVVASLERSDIDADGKRIALQPDMLLKADIILERRSLMSWLTRPLQSVRM